MKKNTATIIILIATVILAGIAIFTAVRLYQLRQSPVAPNEPQSSPAAAEIVSASPKSGNWNKPGTFVVKNNSNQTVQLRYHLDCWEEAICGAKEEQATISLAAGQTIEKGLGDICSKWQLDLNWTGGTGWDWGGIAEKSTNCGETTNTSPCSLSFTFTLSFSSPTPTATASSTPSGSPSPTPTEPPRGGGSPTPSPTTTPVSSVTPRPSSTPAAFLTPTPAALPAAGTTLPTILGIGAGFILLMGAILLAL